MRLASYQGPYGAPTWGVLDGDDLVDLGPSGAGLAGSLKGAIAQGVAGSSLAVPDSAPRTPVTEARFLPVIPDPGKILCVGVNYATHQKETGKPPPPAPTIFTRFADSQVGHGEPALFPFNSEQFDYEGELAVVIGASGFRVAEEDAWSLVAGYAPYNDFSARDWQRATTQWGPGKNFPGTGAFGPFFTPASDVAEVSELVLETRVNGQVRQHAPLSDLVFSIPALIAHITGFTPLAPGDVIVTGTPGGVGLFMEPSGLLQPGDVVEVDVTGLGVLRNEVVREQV